MSKRPIELKQRRRAAKALRRQPLDRYFDLVTWLVDRGHANTRKKARAIILAKRVKANSHVLGVVERLVLSPAGKPEEKNFVAPHVRAELKPDIVVTADA